MEKRLLDILVCSLCKASLQHDQKNNELICKADKLAYPIKDGIPVMLANDARSLSPEEIQAL